jgi:hypothetical protein
MNSIKTSSFYVTLDWVFEFSDNCDKNNAYNYIINKLDYHDGSNNWLKLFDNIYNNENNENKKNYDGYVHEVDQKEKLSYVDWIENKENINPINTLYITCYLLYDPTKINKETQIECMKKAIIKHIDKIKYINKDDNEIHASMKITNLQIEDYNLSKHHEINKLSSSMYTAKLYEI